jgi:peptide/nickel transport system substrate-binding protein
MAGPRSRSNSRRDVIFQDGTPFNAAAVKWNFDRIVDPHYTPGTAAYYLAGYQGTDVVDEFTARVRFSRPGAVQHLACI